MPVVLMGGVVILVVSMCMVFFALALMGNDSKAYQDGNSSNSDEFGKAGKRNYGAVCSNGRHVKKILLSTKDVGPHVVNKRHARVNNLGVQCSDGGKQFGVGRTSDMKTDTSCANGRSMIGFRAFTTDDALQRVEPICERYGQFSNGSSLGKDIGTNNEYLCPDGMLLSGFSGTYSNELNTIMGHCVKPN